MNTIRPCGYKGCKTSLLCEKEFGINKKKFNNIYKDLNAYVFCPACNRLFPGWNVEETLQNHQNHKYSDGFEFPGILVKLNFLDGKELMEKLDEVPWENSQSGRRKQNFSLKTNFKKNKLQNGNFNGFSTFSKFVHKQETNRNRRELL